jgi:hypothetical protein
METKVTLVDWPRYPIETVFYLWEAARHNDPITIGPKEIFERCADNEIYRARVRETFEKVVDSSIPIAENLNFTFLLEGVSISFREQMVRHKIGVKVGERLGVDMFPDIHDSTWWVQSMRVLDMTKFAEDHNFRLPESISEHPNPEVREQFIDQMHQIAATYKFLLEMGVPIEDAREVIPLGAGHRLSWTLNLSALLHIAKKRSCWIPQIGTWGPVIEGMVNELATKVDPYFRKIVTPPCIKKEKFVGCVYKLDNERRVDRSDPLAPCPLYLSNEDGPQVEKDVTWARGMFGVRYEDLEESFRNLWGRDTETGELLQK